MRLRLIALLAALSLVSACQLALPGGQAEPAAQGVDVITVTPLDLPPGDVAAVGEAVPAGAGLPAAQSASPPEAVPPEPVSAEADVPEVVKGPAQLDCERKGGRYVVAGKSGALTCVRPTRDGGKRCTRESDCEGLCLARSQSCAPIKPLFGCNDILQADGRRVTLCID